MLCSFPFQSVLTIKGKLKTVNLYQVRKYFTINICYRWWKKLSRFPHSISTEKNPIKIPISWSIFNLKLFHPEKVIKKLHKSLKTVTIETMEFRTDLQNFPKRIHPEVSENWPYLAALTSFTLTCFILFYNANFSVHHYEHTPLVYVQNIDPNPRTFWLLTQRYYQWKIKCLA